MDRLQGGEATAGASKRGRVGLWRAAAGMALAIAIACVIVLAEFSRATVRRLDYLHGRVKTLGESVGKLRIEAQDKERRFSIAERQLRSRDIVTRVLLARDVKKIPLASTDTAAHG